MYPAPDPLVRRRPRRAPGRAVTRGGRPSAAFARPSSHGAVSSTSRSSRRSSAGPSSSARTPVPALPHASRTARVRSDHRPAAPSRPSCQVRSSRTHSRSSPEGSPSSGSRARRHSSSRSRGSSRRRTAVSPSCDQAVVEDGVVAPTRGKASRAAGRLRAPAAARPCAPAASRCTPPPRRTARRRAAGAASPRTPRRSGRAGRPAAASGPTRRRTPPQPQW